MQRRRRLDGVEPGGKRGKREVSPLWIGRSFLHHAAERAHPPYIDAKRRHVDRERRALLAAPRRCRHAVQRDLQRQRVDGEVARQQARRLADAKRRIAGPQHQRGEAQQAVEHVGERRLVAQAVRNFRTSMKER